MSFIPSLIAQSFCAGLSLPALLAFATSSATSFARSVRSTSARRFESRSFVFFDSARARSAPFTSAADLPPVISRASAAIDAATLSSASSAIFSSSSPSSSAIFSASFVSSAVAAGFSSPSGSS